MIEVLSSGILNTVQDLGRPGWLASGVSLGGAMDAPALEAANILVGNARGAAGIEVQVFPFRLRALVDTMIAVTGPDGDATAGETPLPPWWAAPLAAGQVLTVAPPRVGARAYVAVAGGIDVPPVLGSRSTDLRGGFGGLGGRGLARGDRLPLGPGPAATRLPPGGLGTAPPERIATADAGPPGLVRVVPAAEYESFDDDARAALVAAHWTVTPEANRMGYRLAGPTLALSRHIELLSHGIVPGTVQVPPAGQPIVQLADANTCGGYPKIATVIEADLWRLAQAAVGSSFRFEIVDQPAAVAALRAQRGWMARLAARRALIAG